MKNLFSKLMMVLLIALFALPAKAANGPADLYLVYFKDSAWQYAQFDQSTTDVYTCTHSFSAGEKFYIANAKITLNPTDSNGKPTTKNSTYECSNYNVTSGYNQQVWQYGDSQSAYTCTNAGVYTLTVNFTDSGNIKFQFNSAASTSTYTYSIKGTIDGSDWGTQAMTENNGVWEWTSTVKAGSFGIQKLDKDGNQVNWIWSADKASISVAGVYNAVIQNGDNGANWSSTLAGEYTFSFNPSTMTLTISGGSTPTPSTYSYQLHGTIFDGSSWQSKGMTENNGAWEWKGTVTSGSFGIRMMEGSDQKAWIWSADKSTISAAGEFSAIQQSGDNGKNWSSGLEGEYTFSFNPTAKTLTISGGSSIPVVSYRLKYSEDSWSTSKYSDPLTDKGNGSYEYKITNPVEGLQFMVQRSTDRGKSYLDFCWPDAEDKNYTGGDDTFTMSGALGNNVTFGAGLSGDYTLTFTPNETATASTLEISGAAAVVTTYDEIYLRGSDPLSWNTNLKAYMFTTEDGKIYTLPHVNLNSGVIMKVYKHNPDGEGTYYGYDKATVVGPAVSDGDFQNIKLTANLVDATITVDFSGTKPVITIGNPKSAYLRGDFTDPAWTDKNEYKFSTTDNQIYVLEHVNIANGKLMKVYYGGNYYGHDANKVTGPVIAENDGQSGYNMKLTEELKDATITFDITDAVNWKLTIVNGGAVEHKAYYFAGDLNRWFDKSFEGGSKGGIDAEIFEAEKDKWAFKYVGDVEGLEGTGWYKLDFKAQNLGTLLGQFQIIDRGSWDDGEVYSHNPKVTNYEDASGFARYINSPITRKMIKEGTPLTKNSTPGIVKGNGSNFHLGCNGVNNAVIYFLPGDNPKMIVRGEPTDYFVFYSADGKSGGNNADSKAVSMEIVNGKPNEVNYYLPGVKNLKNYTSADASTEGPHMNIAPVELTKINFSEANFEQSPAFVSVFGASENVGNLTLDQFVNMIKTENKLPNGTSLDGRGDVYVIKIPNGFEYAAGTKFAVKFDKAFAASEIGSTSTIVANHLYFFNDELHVMLNVDNYEDGAEAENAYVKLYYRVYGYDDAYNTVVVNSDGSTTQLYQVGTEIGYTEKGTETQKTAGWVEYNQKGEMGSILSGARTGNWHYATKDSGDIYGLDPKFGNFFVQFKIVTGPKSAQAANGPAKVVNQEYTLYLPEKTLALNQEGFYNFNGQDLYVALDGGYTTTGVEDVFEDQIVEEGVDAEPIFFNLQGQRVVNPEKGMYIVVKGNKTYKVMIK